MDFTVLEVAVLRGFQQSDLARLVGNDRDVSVGLLGSEGKREISLASVGQAIRIVEPKITVRAESASSRFTYEPQPETRNYLGGEIRVLSGALSVQFTQAFWSWEVKSVDGGDELSIVMSKDDTSIPLFWLAKMTDIKGQFQLKFKDGDGNERTKKLETGWVVSMTVYGNEDARKRKVTIVVQTPDGVRDEEISVTGRFITSQ